MDTALRSVVDAIHATPTRAVLALSGGASQAIGWLLSAPGASNSVLEVSVPYSRRSMIGIIGQAPQQFVSSHTARQIALAAYNRALRLSPPGIAVVGLGCTCALVSFTEKKGSHRCFVAARSQGGLREYSLTLMKGRRSRWEEDEVTSRVVIQALSDASCLHSALDLGLVGGGEERVEERVGVKREEEQLEELIQGEVGMVTFAEGVEGASTGGRRVVLSGSFNPLHDGHIGLMRAACKQVAESVPCFEISAINADKPPLEVDQILKRVQQFRDRGLIVVITNQPFFYKKAEQLPDSTIVIGYDTAIRLLNPKYYGNSEEAMVAEIGGIREQGCDFVVAGRVGDGKFQELEMEAIPEEIRDMFVQLPESAFRLDLSSTEIRKRMTKS